MSLPRSSSRSMEGRRSNASALIPVLVTRFSKSMKSAMRLSVEIVMQPMLARGACAVAFGSAVERNGGHGRLDEDAGLDALPPLDLELDRGRIVQRRRGPLAMDVQWP